MDRQRHCLGRELQEPVQNSEQAGIGQAAQERELVLGGRALDPAHLAAQLLPVLARQALRVLDERRHGLARLGDLLLRRAADAVLLLVADRDEPVDEVGVLELAQIPRGGELRVLRVLR